MFTVLVVDDEEIHLNGLTNLIRKLRPEYEILNAKNGKEALAIIDGHPVDILITDIRMPIMDGMELIERTVNKYRDMKILLLSGHREFEYAQKAIKMGVFDYLVKPINKAKISQMLEKVEDSLLEELRKSREKEAMLNQLDTALPIYFERQMNKWITGKLTQEELKEIEGIFENKSKGIAVAMHVTSEFKQRLKPIIKKSLDNLGHSITFSLDNDDNILLIVLAFRSDRVWGEHKEVFTRLADHIEEEFKFRPYFASSSVQSVIFDGIQKAYTEAMKALAYRYYNGESDLLEYDELVCAAPEVYDFEESILKVKDGLQKHDVMVVRRGIAEGYKEVMRYSSHPDPETTKLKLLEVNHELLTQVQNSFSKQIYEQFVHNIEICIAERKSIKNCFAELEKIYMNIVEALKTAESEQTDARMKKCIKYIDEHYMDDLSLENVAEIIYYSASHFSSSFKQYTGKTFLQYLSELRMEKACDLLRNSDVKVYQIADMTGFRDHKYFYRVFKKKFGVTPDTYRRNKKLYE